MGFLASPASPPQMMQQQPLAPETPNVPTDSLEGQPRDTRTIADIRRAADEANEETATLVTEDDNKTLLGT